MKLPYSEGSWFAIPLRNDGYGVGIVARSTLQGKVISVYLFGIKFIRPPKLERLCNFFPNDSIKILRCGDLELIRGNWPVIGNCSNWVRSDWPIPQFIRREDLRNRAWKVEYSDKDPNEIEAEIPWNIKDKSLSRDSLYGAGAVEIALTEILKNSNTESAF